VLGDTIQAPTLDGKIEHKIPAGTQPGTVFTLRGQGIPVLQGGGRRGDLFLRLQVEAPRRLDAQQRALIEQMRAQFPATADAASPQGPPEPPEARHGFFRGKKK
ncbi:MAG: hypothetical protein LBQ33_02125, partial [Oscillospiraceae bacterium]|jgi:DnaJ-class molecular chaperone|nr:hypothetical protein [Oscillospiraceae bacterium]